MVGTNKEGYLALGNGADGIMLHLPGARNVVRGNLVSANAGNGITVLSSDNVVQGNYIGTNLDGTIGFGNGYNGIYIAGSKNQIGGDQSAQRNLISGNQHNGIAIGTEFSATHNVIQGNYVGTDYSGTYAIGNQHNGIYVSGTSHQIGGAFDGQGNLISGNGQNGIVIGGDSLSQYNVVEGNKVGTNKDGNNPIPNGDTGITLWEGVAHNTIGGDTPEAGNLVAFNHDLGIAKWENGLGNRIASNVIHDNDSVALRINSNTSLFNNNVYDNGINRIELPVGTIESNQSWGPQGEADTFFVYWKCKSCDLEVAGDSILTIEAGTQVRMDYNRSLIVYGTLNAQGSSNNPVRLSGPRDTIWAGDWGGVIFKPGSQGYIEHTDVSFAETGLTVEGMLTAENNTIAGNLDSGLTISGSGQVFLDNNSFSGNRYLDIKNQTENIIDARNSWWGNAAGPDPLKIQGEVNTDNWQTTERDNNFWYSAQVLNPGVHEFRINRYDDLDWFRIPVLDSNQILNVSLQGLPRDYDLYLFSHLGSKSSYTEDIARVMWVDKLKSTGNLEGIARVMWVGQLFADSGEEFDTGQLLQASTNPGTISENVSFNVADQVGWHYLLVVGNNGANQPSAPYTLDVKTFPSLSNSQNYVVPGFLPVTSTFTNTTLIVTNRDRLSHLYSEAATELLMEKVVHLASAPDVNGTILDLAEYPIVQSQYLSWTESITSVYKANLVAATVKSLMNSVRTSYPNLEYIVIIGNDQVVPHWRVFDEAPIANEGEYESHTLVNSPLGTAMEQRYFLTDDFYADFTPLAWRGRELYFPEYGIGRLVERPDEIITMIDAYLSEPTLVVTSALVTGYDFLSDLAEGISAEINSVPTVTMLNNNYWSAEDLRNEWFSRTQDFSAINAHFKHWEAVPANLDEANHFKPSDISTRLFNSSGSLVYSVGCHAGLCMPDEQSQSGYELDFCQALASKGVTFIANTGFGYGDTESIGYSELLSLLFIRNLKSGLSIGESLSKAKLDYYQGSAVQSFGPYDEKVLGEVALYGLPMYKVKFPLQDKNSLRAKSSEICSISPFTSSTLKLAERNLSCTFSFTDPITTDIGAFYSVLDEIQVSIGKPIQPRTTVPVDVSGTVAHGAIFEGGIYRSVYDFDPVVTRLITDEVNTLQNEPTFDFQTWMPSAWDVINTVRVKDGLDQKMVIVPAQYYAMTPFSGIERIFETISYTIYYSNKKDSLPPRIWKVTGWRNGSQINFDVEVTDFSNVARVTVAYTKGDGEWHVFDLIESDKPNRWTGFLLDSTDIVFFVQAVDTAGNVATLDNKGDYYDSKNNSIYLPIVYRRNP